MYFHTKNLMTQGSVEKTVLLFCIPTSHGGPADELPSITDCCGVSRCSHGASREGMDPNTDLKSSRRDFKLIMIQSVTHRNSRGCMCGTTFHSEHLGQKTWPRGLRPCLLCRQHPGLRLHGPGLQWSFRLPGLRLLCPARS